MIVECPICGNLSNITKKSYKRNLREHRVRCRSCYNDDEYKELQKIKSNNFWQPRKKLKLYKTRQEINSEISVRSKKLWNDPIYRQKVKDALIRVNYKLSANAKNMYLLGKFRSPVVTLELRKKLSKSTKKLWENAEYRKKMVSHLRRISRENWNRPGYREKIIGKVFKPDNYTSKLEILLESILRELSIEYIHQYVLGPWSFDFYLPKYNILLEMQGDYYHNQQGQIMRDKQKASYINNNFPNLKLKYIWEHETKCKDRLIDYIKYLTGIGLEQIKIDLEKLVIKQVEYKEARLFVDKFHYSGTIGNTKYAYGGYISDKLIALVVFGHLTRSESCNNICKRENILELTRLVIHPTCHQSNLASYFLVRCVKMLPEQFIDLITFADSTFGHIGTVYKASNWQLMGTVKPSYWYVKDGWVMHKKTLWDHASKMGLSENEFADKNGYTKILGKEKYKYHFRRI